MCALSYDKTMQFCYKVSNLRDYPIKNFLLRIKLDCVLTDYATKQNTFNSVFLFFIKAFSSPCQAMRWTKTCQTTNAHWSHNNIMYNDNLVVFNKFQNFKIRPLFLILNISILWIVSHAHVFNWNKKEKWRYCILEEFRLDRLSSEPKFIASTILRKCHLIVFMLD